MGVGSRSSRRSCCRRYRWRCTRIATVLSASLLLRAVPLLRTPLRQSLERLRVGACVLIFHDGIRKSRNLTQRELLTHVIHMESKKIVGIMVDGFRSEGN